MLWATWLVNAQRITLAWSFSLQYKCRSCSRNASLHSFTCTITMQRRIVNERHWVGHLQCQGNGPTPQSSARHLLPASQGSSPTPQNPAIHYLPGQVSGLSHLAMELVSAELCYGVTTIPILNVSLNLKVLWVIYRTYVYKVWQCLKLHMSRGKRNAEDVAFWRETCNVPVVTECVPRRWLLRNF